jgi:hypothetical protein
MRRLLLLALLATPVLAQQSPSPVRAQHEAIAKLSFLEGNWSGSATVNIRAYNNGHYVDTELSVDADGFSWGYSAGQVHITNTMHLVGGEWDEKTVSTAGQNPPLTIVEMLLKHRQ